MAVIVDQTPGRWLALDGGTSTDIYTLLRVLLLRAGKPHVGYSSELSFKYAEGMCRECHRLGKKLGVL